MFAVLFPNFSKPASCWWYLCYSHYCTKTIFTISSYLHYRYGNSCSCLTASRWLYSTSWSAVRDSHICSIIWSIAKQCILCHCNNI